MSPVRTAEVRSSLIDRPLPLVLRPSSGRKTVSLVYLGLFALGLVKLLHPLPVTLTGMLIKGAIALWLLKALFAQVAYLHPNGTFLRLDSAGFTVCNSFLPRQVPWAAVKRFMPVDMSSSASVVKVAWQYLPDYLGGKPIGHLAGWRKQEFDGALSENYGLKPQELADFLNELKDRFSPSDALQADRANSSGPKIAAHSPKALSVLAQPLPIKLSGGLAKILISQAVVIVIVCAGQFGTVGFWLLLLGLSAIVLFYVYPNANMLKIHSEGFTVRSYFKEETVRWEAITEFVPNLRRHSPYVGWRYHPEHVPDGQAVKLSRILMDVEGTFSETYGLPTTDLADILNEMLARYRAGELAPSSA